MSFLYPNTIKIARPRATPAQQVGDVGYNADRGTAADEKLVLKGIACSIQFDRQGQRNGEGLATDGRYQANYKIFVPKTAVRKGAIQDRDIAIDELGKRYQCFAAVWQSLGYTLQAIILEV